MILNDNGEEVEVERTVKIDNLGSIKFLEKWNKMWHSKASRNPDTLSSPECDTRTHKYESRLDSIFPNWKS